MNASPLIEMRGVYKAYVNEEVVTPVLHDVSLQVERGEFLAVMGPSGSGKSTLMNIMGFLDRLSSGEYRFEGKDVTSLTDDELAYMRRYKVGFIFQSFQLLPRTSVLENVMLPLMYHKISGEDRIERASAAVAAVGLAHRLHHTSNQLSGGEKQRVAVARALVTKPSILFADEPTGSLDTKTSHTVLEEFQKLHDEKMTIVMITHDPEASEYASRTIRIRDGRIE